MSRANILLGLSLSLSLVSGSALAAPKPPVPVRTDLSLWLEADVGLAADGSTWADQSGNHHDATALPGQAPTVDANGLHNKPAAMFFANRAMSVAGSLLTSQQYTIIAVVQDEGDSEHGFQEIISNWDGLNSDTSVFLGTTTTQKGKKFEDRIRFTDALGGADEGQIGRGKISKPQSTPIIMGGVSDTANASIYQNTKAVYSLGHAMPARDLSTPWFVGRQGSSPFEYWNGAISEILVYNRALTAAEIKTNVNYLHKKWLTNTPIPPVH